MPPLIEHTRQQNISEYQSLVVPTFRSINQDVPDQNKRHNAKQWKRVRQKTIKMAVKHLAQLHCNDKLRRRVSQGRAYRQLVQTKFMLVQHIFGHKQNGQHTGCPEYLTS